MTASALVPSTLPFSEISSRIGDEIAANPEKSSMSIAIALPASTRNVRFAVMLSPIMVKVSRPGGTGSSVSGDSPAALPSISTRAPGGLVVMVTRPAFFGTGFTGGSAGAGAGADLTTLLISG